MMIPPLAIWESPMAWLLILIVALLIFGHKLPSVARSLGSSVSEFKKGVKDGELESQADQPQAPQAQPQLQQPSQPMSQIKCGACGTVYIPAAVGAPCPGCGSRPRVTSAAERN